MANRKMRLVAVLQTGPVVQHHGMWRHPDTDNRFMDAAAYEDLARLLEQGRFDAVFFADAQGLFGDSGAEIVEQGGAMTLLDPMPILAMMARVTQHLGLGATLSTTHIPTYHLARTIATLDLLSGGRAAWNVVTSSSAMEAQNFGSDNVVARVSRYDRADEVLEACMKLWSSWEDDALIMDKQSGLFADSGKVHAANYEGQAIRTKGPLTVPRSPQGSPVIMQAGASERGREFAARWAEVIFTVQTDIAGMKAFYDDVKGRMARYGRAPDDCAILASINVIAAETEAIAREKQAYVNSLVTVEQGITLMSNHLGFDVGALPLDEPIVDIDLEVGSRGVFDIILAASRNERLTVREAARLYATTALTPQIVGTPEQVADEMQHYFENRGCDGFIVNPITMPGSFEQMVRLVVPELQRRGLFRRDYVHATLRGMLQE